MSAALAGPGLPNYLVLATKLEREREREREGPEHNTPGPGCDQHNSCFCKLNICSEPPLCICIVRPSLYPLSSSTSQHSLYQKAGPALPGHHSGRDYSVLEVGGNNLGKGNMEVSFRVKDHRYLSLQSLAIIRKSLIWFWAFKHNLRLNNRTDVSAVFLLNNPRSRTWRQCGVLVLWAERQSV